MTGGANWYRKGNSGMLLPLPKNGGVHMGRFFFWAEGGQVNMVDNHSGRHSAWFPRHAEEKLKRIAQTIGTSTTPGMARDAQERTEMLRAMQQIEGLIRQAREQGANIPEIIPGCFS